MVLVGSTSWSETSYELALDAKANSILLDASSAARIHLTPATYDYTSLGIASYATGHTFRNLVFRYAAASSDITSALATGETRTLEIRQVGATPHQHYETFATVLDWSNLDDNEGTMTLQIGDQTIEVDSRENCILLSDTRVVSASLPEGPFFVSFSGNARTSYSGGYYSEVVIHYRSPVGDISCIVPMHDTVAIYLAAGEPNFAALFFDWSTIHDNSGTGYVTLTRRDPTIVSLDIKPGSCPNPLNLRSYRDEVPTQATDDQGATTTIGKLDPGIRAAKAVLPVAILGAADFSVADIDASTLMLAGVPLLRWSYEDVATPVAADAGECACNDLGPDGYTDLTLKFYRDDIIAALGEVYDGDMVPLTLTGGLLDGTPIEGTDCVLIVNGPEPPKEELPVLVGNFPNPFNPTTRIGFALPAASDVRLVVYNVMGQIVTVVADGRFGAGSHSVEWNGCDADGTPAASGIYLYRLETAAHTETRKMLLLK